MFIRDGTPSGFKIISTGVPSGRKRHVLVGQDAGDDAFIAVAARHLVTLHDLALLGDIDADEHVHARRQLIARQPLQFTLPVVAGQRLGALREVEDPARLVLVLIARELFDIDDLALFAVRNAQRNVACLFGFLAEDGDDQPLFRRQFRLALRRDATGPKCPPGGLRRRPG